MLTGLSFGSRVQVFDAKAGKSAINTHSEELTVIVVETHPLDLLRMSLHLTALLHSVVGVTEDLDGAWTVRLGKASVD